MVTPISLTSQGLIEIKPKVTSPRFIVIPKDCLATELIDFNCIFIPIKISWKLKRGNQQIPT
jgi:hypothetical protein